jgi:carotenoid cleavage dioxygenase-like enzyme
VRRRYWPPRPLTLLDTRKEDSSMSSLGSPFVHDEYFAPVPDEITAHDLPIVGTLPTELNGTYVRNGPNPRPGSPLPFFAGDGMLHGVRIEGGRARWYRNRYVKTRRDAGIRGGRSSNTHVFAHARHLLRILRACSFRSK